MNTVLVVDDEPIIRNGIKIIAQQYPRKKLQIVTANNGVEALQILSKQLIHIVLTDIRMPKMDGLGLCEEIAKHYPHVRTIVISGYDDFNFAKQAMRFGVREYLLKPVHAPDLYSVLDKLHQEWEQVSVTISLSKYEDWMESIEETIWKLDMDHLPDVLQQWEAHCKKMGLDNLQLAQLVRECLENIKKRLAKRSFQAHVEFSEELETLSKKHIFERFREKILHLVDQLMKTRGAKLKDPFEEAKNYIDTHLAEEITLEEMAQRVGISPTYFSHLFKKETNETFIQYRIRKRMEQAMKLLEIPHYRIIDICQAVGYSDYPHFTKTFKKFAGVSPSQYRRNMGIDP